MRIAMMARSRRPTTVGGVEGSQKLPGARHGDLGRFALDHLVALAADRERRIEQDGVAGDQVVEKVPQGGQVLLAGGHGGVFFP